MAQDSSARAPGSAGAPLPRLLRYARGHRRTVIWASFCSVLNKLFDVAPEILIGMAIDVVIRREDSFLASLGLVEPFQQILALGLLTFLVWAGESLFEYLYQLAWRNLAQTLQHELRLDTYAHVQRLDLAVLRDRSSGDLVSILNDDINQLERFLDGGANRLIQVGTSVVAVGAVFFALSPLVAALSFVPVPIILWGAFYYQRRAEPLYAEVRAKVGALAARLANNLSGIATIKSFTAEARELEHLREQSEGYREANKKAIAVSSAFIPVIRMAILSGFLATLLVGGWMVLHGELEVGAYGLLVFLTQRLLWPLTGMAETVDLYERAMASTRRVLDLLETPIGIPSGEVELDTKKIRGDIQIEGLTFAYRAGHPVLSGIALDIEGGSTVAFVGQTGSGKSSLMRLLLRLYEPGEGRILLDGVPLSEIELGSLRAAIGLVSQEVFLFEGSVRENLAFGRPGASDEEIEEAARLAEAHGFIRALPEGYDTQIGERGQKLSGGQRQRLAIARALLKDPPILVLDEATSAVDNETEAAIQRSLAKITEGRTTLMIAHRLSTIVDADRIYVLDRGQIREQGRHAELLERGGIYAGLWRVQTGGRGALPASGG